MKMIMTRNEGVEDGDGDGDDDDDDGEGLC